MSGSKHINLICVIATVLAVLITVLFMNGEALGIEVIVDADAESYTGSEVFTENDLDGAWDDSSATQITLNGTDAHVSGSGAYVLNGSVYISNAGRYVVSGTLTNGQIVVDTYQSSKVWVELAGADITCEEDAAFRVNQADKVFLTLKEGTVNSLTSGETYSDTALSDNAGGTIFSHDDLTINGSGTLTVTANYKHGIDANDSLVITGGNITVKAVNDGLHANDSVRLTNTELTIEAGDDAIHCDLEIIVESGEIQIPSCHEGLEAPQITVTGGNITIYSEDDGFNANGAGGSGIGFITGNEEDGTVESIDAWIDISGGNITIIIEHAQDSDGLDSNGDIYISGGTVRVSLPDSGNNSAIDYASESGGVCEITGGELIIEGGEGSDGTTPPEPPEGMEGMTPPELPEGTEGTTPPELPALPGEAPQQTTDTTAATDTGTASAGTALSSLGTATWTELGTSAVILLLGIGIAMLYQRRR